MKSITLALGLAVSLAYFVSEAHAHGTPINAYVQSATGQLAVFDGYEPGELESLGGSDIFTDAPGIGISSLVNGFQPDDLLHLDVVQGLLYWDGLSVVPATATLAIDWPDDGGTSLVETYQVTDQSTYQTGMLWGKYRPPGGTGSWDAHGDYSLEAANPAVGIYGLVLQLAASGHIASEPFLLPLVYDPSSGFGAIQVAEGIAALQQAVQPLPTADFDRSTRVDAVDLGIWQTGYGTLSGAFLVEGDATENEAIAGDDFLAWQRQFSGAVPPTALTNLNAIPEPATLLLAIVLGIVYFAFFRFQKQFPN